MKDWQMQMPEAAVCWAYSNSKEDRLSVLSGECD